MALDRSLANVSFTLAEKDTKEWISTYLSYDNFSDLRGKGFGNVIVTKGVSVGDTAHYGQIQPSLDLVDKYYGEQVSGTGKEPSFSSYQNKIGIARFTAGVTEIDFESRILGKDLQSILDSMLTEKAKYNLFIRTMQAFFMSACYKSTYTGNNFAIAPKIYTFDEIVTKVLATSIVNTANAAAAVVGDVMSNNRIVFGNDFNTNAAGNPINGTIAATIGQGGFTAAAGHGATLDHFNKMRLIAKVGMRPGNKSIYMENAIRGIRADKDPLGYMTDKYLILISEGTAAYLESTDDWKSQVNRAVIEDAAKQPSIYRGSSYLGTIKGNIFIVDPTLDKYALDATTHVSFLVGSRALAHSTGTGKDSSPKITVQTEDHTIRKELCYHETLGIRPFMFPSLTDGNKKGDTNPLLVGNIIMGVAKIA